MTLRRIDQTLVDETLRGGVCAATLADSDPLGVVRQRDRLRMHERIVEDDVCALEQACGSQRQQVGCAGTGSDEVDLAHDHW